MTAEQMVAGLIAWVEAVLPEIPGARKAPESDFPLPDVACAVTNVLQRPHPQVQQVIERLRTCELMIAVDPDPPDSADSVLYSFTERLMDELVKDDTLGGRVTQAEKAAEVRFEPPFVEFDGGGRARQATLVVLVRDRVS